MAAGSLESASIAASDTENIGSSGTYTHVSGKTFVVGSDTNGVITGTNEENRVINAPVGAYSCTHAKFKTVNMTTTRANNTSALTAATLIALPV